MLEKATFDVPTFFERRPVQSAWFWQSVICIVSVPMIVIAGTWQRAFNLSDPFPFLFLMAALILVLFEFLSSLESYRTIRSLEVDWRPGAMDPSVSLAIECAARSIKRSPLICAAAVSFAAYALR